jgi:hypothetical protein
LLVSVCVCVCALCPRKRHTYVCARCFYQATTTRRQHPNQINTNNQDARQQHLRDQVGARAPAPAAQRAGRRAARRAQPPLAWCVLCCVCVCAVRACACAHTRIRCFGLCSSGDDGCCAHLIQRQTFFAPTNWPPPKKQTQKNATTRQHLAPTNTPQPTITHTHTHAEETSTLTAPASQEQLERAVGAIVDRLSRAAGERAGLCVCAVCDRALHVCVRVCVVGLCLGVGASLSAQERGGKRLLDVFFCCGAC